ncbi:hypothetical protein [Patulibacter minatonensis]|uniref:hypothetical protein n=1 Tax=Patulibacter minatonensis TaxID=298163 RepID=UPI00047E8B04|nr:hypothetical protein [Patulibacter minatonensis]
MPTEHGAPPDGGDRARVHSPSELRAEALSVLERTRSIGPSLRRGSRQAIDEIDALTASIRLLQERVDAAARRPQGVAAATELVAARRCIQASLTVVLDLLAELDH